MSLDPQEKKIVCDGSVAGTVEAAAHHCKKDHVKAVAGLCRAWYRRTLDIPCGQSTVGSTLGRYELGDVSPKLALLASASLAREVLWLDLDDKAATRAARLDDRLLEEINGALMG